MLYLGDLECLPDGDGYNMYYAMFIVGQIGNGLSGGIIFAVAVPYLDENTKAKNTPVYIGIKDSRIDKNKSSIVMGLRQ